MKIKADKHWLLWHIHDILCWNFIAMALPDKLWIWWRWKVVLPLTELLFKLPNDMFIKGTYKCEICGKKYKELYAGGPKICNAKH
jgi:hypothetical protein